MSTFNGPSNCQDESITNSPFLVESHKFSAKSTKFNRQHPWVRSEKAQSCEYVQVSSRNKPRPLVRKFSLEKIYFFRLLSFQIRLKTCSGVTNFQLINLIRSLLVRFLKMHKLLTIISLAIFLSGGAVAQQQVWGQCQSSLLSLPCYLIFFSSRWRDWLDWTGKWRSASPLIRWVDRWKQQTTCEFTWQVFDGLGSEIPRCFRYHLHIHERLLFSVCWLFSQTMVTVNERFVGACLVRAMEERPPLPPRLLPPINLPLLEYLLVVSTVASFRMARSFG